MSTPDQNVDNVSLSGLVATLVPTAVIAAVYFLIFLVLRKTQRRFYAPRTYLGTLREEERTAPLPNGLLNWFRAFWKIPDIYALQHQSLDAYLFLRFLRMTVLIMFVGSCITWPILFPINITGGAGGEQLDKLSMSNVDKNASNGKYKYFAHCFAAWAFFGFVLFLVTRESIFYINLRQAFLLSPVYANRISARTVLFTSVPEPYLDQARLRKVFGDSVKNIWITADTTAVDELVEERDKVAYMLEAAEIKLIKLANAERLKALKNGAPNPEEELLETPLDAESGSIAARWLPQKKRPTHKLGKFGLVGKKVDTIDWCRSRLEALIPEVDAAQAAYLAGETEAVGGVFIEFARQSDAQAAFQTLSHHQALHMSPRYIGVNPNEVIWKSLAFPWWQKVIRRIVVIGFITAMIIFWAIPVAFVGLVSNITYLKSYSWLQWLDDIPTVIMGVISGLLPSVLLAILMSLVPVVMRICGKLAGEPSTSRVELFTQNAYFMFQVIQVFLVVTLAASASALIKQLQNDPGSITSLLAERIPTASNFYISYFIVQGLTVAASVLSQVVGFVIFTLIYKFLANTPRKMYTKWSGLSAISWGSTLPVFTNIAVIGIVYSCIAPLVLGFATIGMSLFYLAFRYNILFVTDSQIDTKGLIYPRALQQLLTGVYLAEISLIGLFSIATTIGPLILMVILLVFTVLFHFSLNQALGPLLYNLPKSLEAEEEFLRGSIEAANPASADREKRGDITEGSAAQKEPNFISKFLKPHIYSDYATLRRLVPHGLLDPDNLYEETVANNAYHPPSVTSPTPLLWIPRDQSGISRQEISHTAKVIPITDEGCMLDEKNKLSWDSEGARPPLWSPKIYY
ncbi:uncharacterized protein L3040_004746 [Drepanopeziza brunnea f. sp. 'multigermtubi']|uniref:DUF221 domain-containing protein n=1 Tax=Marssonina brunnea f. sp. multigermtubi (strain MB_m1) TaxID=1072389 RepID=K1WZ85_MARBU|nr:uncharacterized protein MBM_03289 [Drepanopeziza brunnea f. sp. 'multigermtubi' MB_m1]EKD18296.1 hypothetical protein MBM_03289 [Drepanopeziza brunnea f. sp. 'multigermtubi' MB_m1]KAJ5042191.1 hypothetical protein L3040_004746 [Drepanopeziza brunnea f. sp. 'multigermtubi']